MITIPNILSSLRVPLAFVFLSTNPLYRAISIVTAMITDGLDGFIARRYKMISKTGTFLDPVMDKFFVLFAVATFIHEDRLTLLESASLICRDFSVLLFGCYLTYLGKLSQYKFRSIWCGKATTFFQFLVLIALSFGIAIPSSFYFVFVALGLLALVELYLHLEHHV